MSTPSNETGCPKCHRTGTPQYIMGAGCAGSCELECLKIQLAAAKESLRLSRADFTTVSASYQESDRENTTLKAGMAMVDAWISKHTSGCDGVEQVDVDTVEIDELRGIIGPTPSALAVVECHVSHLDSETGVPCFWPVPTKTSTPSTVVVLPRKGGTI